MTAEPAPAPVHQPEPPWVVRLRMRTHAWTSPGMSRVDAESRAVTLTEQLSKIGETWRFVTFEGRGGRLFEVRAREVVAVEVAVEGTAEPRPRTGVHAADVQIHVDEMPIPDGTTFLRQRAAGRRGAPS